VQDVESVMAETTDIQDEDVDFGGSVASCEVG
jgi:hypothetical protein